MTSNPTCCPIRIRIGSRDDIICVSDERVETVQLCPRLRSDDAVSQVDFRRPVLYHVSSCLINLQFSSTTNKSTGPFASLDYSTTGLIISSRSVIWDEFKGLSEGISIDIGSGFALLGVILVIRYCGSAPPVSWTMQAENCSRYMICQETMMWAFVCMCLPGLCYT